MSMKQNFENQTGIYKLGFNPWSFLGIALAVGIPAVVGGILAFIFVL